MRCSGNEEDAAAEGESAAAALPLMGCCLGFGLTCASYGTSYGDALIATVRPRIRTPQAVKSPSGRRETDAAAVAVCERTLSDVNVCFARTLCFDPSVPRSPLLLVRFERERTLSAHPALRAGSTEGQRRQGRDGSRSQQRARTETRVHCSQCTGSNSLR
jgi:hypothetical protein